MRARATKMLKMHFFCIFFAKNLHMSKKSSTFALAFERNTFRDAQMIFIVEVKRMRK